MISSHYIIVNNTEIFSVSYYVIENFKLQRHTRALLHIDSLSNLYKIL